MSLKQVLVNVATPNTLATLQMYRDSMCEAVLPIRPFFLALDPDLFQISWIQEKKCVSGFSIKNPFSL